MNGFFLILDKVYLTLLNNFHGHILTYYINIYIYDCLIAFSKRLEKNKEVVPEYFEERI